MGLISGILGWALLLYELAVLIHFVLVLVKPASNKWIELLNSIVEPALKPIRKLLVEKLPAKYQNFDWSHVVLFLLVALIRFLL